eukprot:1158658-Pelagomonas_calceolata.AAC.4
MQTDTDFESAVEAIVGHDQALNERDEHWDCPACAPLSHSQKLERHHFSKHKIIHVQWHPRLEAAEMLQLHPDLRAHVQAHEQEIPEQTADPPTNVTDLDNLVKQGFEGDPQSLANSPWLSTTGCAICKNVTFDFQPTDPQADIMPTRKCEIIIRTVRVTEPWSSARRATARKRSPD